MLGQGGMVSVACQLLQSFGRDRFEPGENTKTRQQLSRAGRCCPMQVGVLMLWIMDTPRNWIMSWSYRVRQSKKWDFRGATKHLTSCSSSFEQTKLILPSNPIGSMPFCSVQNSLPCCFPQWWKWRLKRDRFINRHHQPSFIKSPTSWICGPGPTTTSRELKKHNNNNNNNNNNKASWVVDGHGWISPGKSGHGHQSLGSRGGFPLPNVLVAE